jgi:hypothetical protein
MQVVVHPDNPGDIKFQLVLPPLVIVCQTPHHLWQ